VSEVCRPLREDAGGIVNRPQLHLITDPALDPLKQIRRIELAAPHGVDAVHLRLPDASARELYELAMVLQGVLVERNIPLIVNDRVDVALAVNAGGVQLGSRGLPLRAVRRMLGPAAPVGASVHAAEAAAEAERDGATWVTYGHIWETGSHPGEPGRGVDALREVVGAVSIPAIAIGGVTAERVPAAIAAGASGVAVISAILAADDPADATRAMRAALDS
jgi:thiamine-phosphate diphosphorylase